MRHDKPASQGTSDTAGRDVHVSAQGLVFDFSGGRSPDIRDLSLLLTARMLAERDDRSVWVKALPLRTWEVLHALGLAHLFRLFPSGGASGN